MVVQEHTLVELEEDVLAFTENLFDFSPGQNTGIKVGSTRIALDDVVASEMPVQPLCPAKNLRTF
jgi:hypothetical protein